MKNKKILVTGGAGFIGSNLTNRLFQEEADLTVLVKYKSIIDNVRLAHLWDRINIIEADLRNSDSLRPLQGEYFDIIFHLAAYNHVGDSFTHVNEAMVSNATATANLLEAGINYDKLVYTSTSEVYGFQKSAPFVESMVPYPISPYSVGKYAGELYAKMKRHQTKENIVCIRPFNTFGPYQSDRAVIPELIIKCLRGVPVETTEGLQTREFNYVDNIVDGFLAIADVNPPPEKTINVGSGEDISIADLVRKIHELSDSKSDLRIGALKNRPTEIWKMNADNSIAAEKLNWNPKVSFDEGLKRTIDWFRNYLEVFYNMDSSLNSLSYSNSPVNI